MKAFLRRTKKFVSCFAVLAVAVFSLFVFTQNSAALNTVQLHGVKNVIIMIGDGMGPTHEEAGRIYSGRDLAWDSMPYSGISATESLSGVTDSAAAGTAMSTGQIVPNGYVARSGPGQNLKTIMEYAQELGRKTGVITTAELYDATPAAFSAKANDRGEYEAIRAAQVQSGIDLLIGQKGDGYDTHAAALAANGYQYITQKSGLNQSALSAEKIFAALPEIKPAENQTANSEELYNLVDFGLEFLENENGFVLMVEGAKIDKSSHQRDIQQMIYELMAFDKAVDLVLEWASQRDDTVVIVTADHETGGLQLSPNVIKSNITSGSYNTWNAWDGNPDHQTSHTAIPVNYYFYGPYCKYLKDSVRISDIFNMQYFFLHDYDEYNKGDILSPYGENDLSLNVAYQEAGGPKLNISVSGGEPEYKYQYWLKTKIMTDEEANLGGYRYVWQVRQGFTLDSTKAIPVTEDDVDEDGNYNVIVRVMDGDDKLVDELYGCYYPYSVGKMVISEISINGRKAIDDYFVVNKDTIANIEVKSSIGGNYSLYYNDAIVETNQDGIFYADINSLNTGFNYIKIRAWNDNSSHERTIKIYVYDVYEANKKPVIKSLEGETGANGSTVFTMRVQYADGSPIAQADKDDFVCKLTSGSVKAAPSSVEVVDGCVVATFNVNYNGRYGIYQTTATVAKSGKDGYDDMLIKYYDKYVRNASVSITAETAVSKNTPVVIEANGSITGAAGTPLYAFYREDASGWVLIRDYAASNTLTWTPAQNGTYHIQARIKAADGGSYEAYCSEYFTVGETELEGDLSLKVYDYLSGDEADRLTVGKPYILQAEYDGPEDMLYLFALKTDSLGFTYLRKFSPSPYYVFIPDKVDSFDFTVRAITSGNFGYKDISFNLTVNAYIDIELELAASNYEMLLSEGSFTIPSQDITVASGSKPVTITYTAIYEGQAMDASDGVIEFIGAGYYYITVRATDIYGNYKEKTITLTVLSSVDLLDFESGYHMEYVTTTNDNNAVVINRAVYSQENLSGMMAGYGEYGLKLTPTVNPWPEVHFVFNETFPAGTRIKFNCYIKTSLNIAYAWNYKNPAGGAGMGEIDISKDGTNRNKWFRAEHTFNFSFNEVWLWLYLDCAAPDANKVDIIIDDFKILTPMEDGEVLTFEDPDQASKHIVSRNPLGHDMHVDVSVVNYSQTGLTAPDGCGEKVLKLTPTHPDCGYLLFEVYNGHVIPMGSTIRFKLYIESPVQVNNFTFRYWDNTINDVNDLATNRWHEVVMHTLIDSGKDGKIYNYIYAYFRNRSVSPATGINVYIDNLAVLTPEESFDFETDADGMYFYCTKALGHDMHVNINTVTYQQAGITAPAGGGERLLRIAPTHTNSGYFLFEVYNGFIIPAGSTISMKMYIQAPESRSDFYLRYWDNSADDARNLATNQWLDVTITASIDSGRDGSVENYIYLFLRNYYRPSTDIVMYIDNFVIDADEYIPGGGSGEDADFFHDYEDDAQLSLYESENPLGHNMHVAFSIVTYAQAGLTAPAGGGEKLLKINPTRDDCTHFLFNIYNGFVIPAGSTIRFNLYIVCPASRSDFYIRYWDNDADDYRNIASNQWHNVQITTSKVSGRTEAEDFIYIFLRNYYNTSQSDSTPATGVIMYMDNFEIILNQ